MKNAKIIAWGLVASIGLSFLTAVFGWREALYTLAGLGMLVFGIWAIVVLFQNAE